MRSCYYQILEQSSIGSSSSSGQAQILSPEEWRWLWGLQLPPKVRTFLWRACNDIIPVRVTVMHRHLGSDPYCSLCCLHLESTSHIFFECPWFSWIWSVPPFDLVLPTRHTNFIEWFRWLRDELDMDGFILACVVCWRIWLARNQLAHGSTERVELNIVEWAVHFLEAYRVAQLTTTKAAFVSA